MAIFRIAEIHFIPIGFSIRFAARKVCDWCLGSAAHQKVESCPSTNPPSAATPSTRITLHGQIRDKVRSITGMNCVIELVPPRTLPRTSPGKLSRAKAKTLYLSGEIEPFKLAA